MSRTVRGTSTLKKCKVNRAGLQKRESGQKTPLFTDLQNFLQGVSIDIGDALYQRIERITQAALSDQLQRASAHPVEYIYIIGGGSLITDSGP